MLGAVGVAPSLCYVCAMQLEHESVEELKRKVRRIAAKHLDLSEYRVFFFGSRVGGRASARSDIDVGIEGPRPIPLEVLTWIREEIQELPVLYKIDVVDFQRASEDFREIALKHIELITP